VPGVSSPKRHYYRVEISGGHTGSAFRYHSGVFGTLDEVTKFVKSQGKNDEDFAFLLGERPVFLIEYYEDGVLRHRAKAFPALRIRVGDRKIKFDLKGRWKGLDADSGELDVAIDQVLSEFDEMPPKLTLELEKLALPEPRGEALSSGKSIAVETASGKKRTQPYGVVGDFFDGKKFC
jgi:hypothetical protein